MAGGLFSHYNLAIINIYIHLKRMKKEILKEKGEGEKRLPLFSTRRITSLIFNLYLPLNYVVETESIGLER